MNFFQAMKRGTQAARRPARNPVGQTANERVRVTVGSFAHGSAPQSMVMETKLARPVTHLQNFIDVERKPVLRDGQSSDTRHAWRDFKGEPLKSVGAPPTGIVVRRVDYRNAVTADVGAAPKPSSDWMKKNTPIIGRVPKSDRPIIDRRTGK